MSTIRIPLNSRKYPGLYALIDEADFELVSQYQWHPKPRPTVGFYAATTVRSGGKRRELRMHRLILAAPREMEVDHADGNGLDNRRGNLRLATKVQNMANRCLRISDRNTTSRYKGVNLRNASTKIGAKKWEAKLCSNGKVKFRKSFYSEIEAAQAYDSAARHFHGEFATLNFPNAGERSAQEEIENV